MQKDNLDIFLNNNLRLIIYPHSDNALLFEEADAADYGESRWQLQEGREYEYEFVDSVGNPANAYFVEIPRVIKPRKGHINEGSIITGIYVGTLLLQWVDGLTGNQYDFRLEIQSIKTDYRRDYRKMLSAFKTSIISSKRSLTRMRPSRRFGFAYMGSRYNLSTNLLMNLQLIE